MTEDNSLGPAVVTGASRGLGLGVASAFAAAGYPVVMVGRDGRLLEAVGQSMAGRVLPLATDVRDEDEVQALIEQAVRRFGPIEALVNAAGATPNTDLPDVLTWDAWTGAIETDVRGVFNTVRAASGRFAPEGTVINFSAGAVSAGSPMHTAFAPAQAALASLSRCLGAWLQPQGVVTHCVYPSLTLAGTVGRVAAKAFGAPNGLTAAEFLQRRFGPDMLDKDTAGAAVLALVSRREPGDWALTPHGPRQWEPLPVPGAAGWGTAIQASDVRAGAGPQRP